MKSKFAPFLLAASLVLASNTGFAADVSANLRLMAFGSAAQLKAVTNAVARFNQKYPNIKVEIAIDLALGRGRATVWTCDLSAEYVRINAEYRT